MSNQHIPYTAQEDAYLSANYATAPKADIMARLPDRSWPGIQTHAGRLHASGRPVAPPIRLRTVWNLTNLALLRALYPTGGAAAVAAATGLSHNAVRMCAARQAVRCTADLGSPPRLIARRDRPAVARAERPVLPMKPDRSSTPNANANLNKRRRDRPVVAVTADQIRKLDYNDPRRKAYTNGGIAGWTQYMNAQA